MSGNRKRKRGRGFDHTGRSTKPDRFVKLPHWMLNSAAWQATRCVERALLVELLALYNGFNNGEIAFSVRQAALTLHVAKDTAQKAFRGLEEKGFIRRTRRGSFRIKFRHASLWEITLHPLGDELATKNFMRWHPPKNSRSADKDARS